MKETTGPNFLNIELERPAFVTVVFYLFAIGLIEVLWYYNGPVFGAIGNAFLVFLAINQAVLMGNSTLYRILPAIALLPFLRLLSLIVPVSGWSLQINHVLVTIPVLATVGLMTVLRKIPLVELGLGRPVWRTQLFIALSGLPLGFIGFLLLRPAPLFASSGLVSWMINLLIVLFCIALVEELVFRGIFLHFITEISEQFSLLVSGMLYGIMNIGSHSPIYAIFMGLVGWLFAFFVIRTRSIWGVVVAHFLLIAGMGLFWVRLF